MALPASALFSLHQFNSLRLYRVYVKAPTDVIAAGAQGAVLFESDDGALPYYDTSRDIILNISSDSGTLNQNVVFGQLDETGSTAVAISLPYVKWNVTAAGALQLLVNNDRAESVKPNSLPVNLRLMTVLVARVV